jgi:hypothetical protein
MTYYFKINGSLARKEGGDPPKIDEYVAVGQDNIVRHIKDGQIIEEREIKYPNTFPKDASPGDIDLRKIYKDAVGFKITKEMLYPQYRKKNLSPSKPKSKRKIKKCKCNR